MIKKEDKGYSVYNSKGNKRLGKHKSRKKALRQVAAVEISKKKRGKRAGY